MDLAVPWLLPLPLLLLVAVVVVMKVEPLQAVLLLLIERLPSPPCDFNRPGAVALPGHFCLAQPLLLLPELAPPSPPPAPEAADAS
jgi:hypothetical protein